MSAAKAKISIVWKRKSPLDPTVFPIPTRQRQQWQQDKDNDKCTSTADAKRPSRRPAEEGDGHNPSPCGSASGHLLPLWSSPASATPLPLAPRKRSVVVQQQQWPQQQKQCGLLLAHPTSTPPRSPSISSPTSSRSSPPCKSSNSDSSSAFAHSDDSVPQSAGCSSPLSSSSSRSDARPHHHHRHRRRRPRSSSSNSSASPSSRSPSSSATSSITYAKDDGASEESSLPAAFAQPKGELSGESSDASVEMSEHEAKIARKRRQIRIRERWEMLRYKMLVSSTVRGDNLLLLDHTGREEQQEEAIEDNDEPWDEEREREYVFSLL